MDDRTGLHARQGAGIPETSQLHHTHAGNWAALASPLLSTRCRSGLGIGSLTPLIRQLRAPD